MFTDMASQHVIDQRLVPDAAATGFLPELLEHSGIDADRDELARFVAERRPPDASQGLQLLRRRLRDIREVNRSGGTPPARADSRAAR